MLATLSTLLVATASLITAAPITPSLDPFYTPTGNWQLTAPGTILSSRSVTIAAYGVLPLPVASYQLLYRTNDISNNPLAAVTTIMVPLIAAPDKLLAYSIAEDSTNTRCAPSYLLQEGSGTNNTEYVLEEVLMAGALAQGWIVTTSDHEGPKSTYAAGRQEGRVVLDSIRATLNFGPTIGLLPSAKIAMAGYSGGATATGWASSLAGTYAPELNIVGAAFGGTPSNLTATALYLNGGPNSGFMLASLIGVSNAYPAFSKAFNTLATAKTKALIADDIANQCNGDSPADNINFFNTTDYFTSGPNTIYNSVWQATLQNSQLGSGGAAYAPKMPIYLYHALDDEFIPYATAQTLYSTWCANGAIVDFETTSTTGIEHVTEAVLGYPGALVFLAERLNGLAPPTACVSNSPGLDLTGAIAIADNIPGFAAIYAMAIGLLG